MGLSFNEEIALRAALMAVRQERKDSLRNMFAGTQLQPKSRVQDALTLAKEAAACAKAAKRLLGKTGIPNLRAPEVDLPGIGTPEVPEVEIPDLDVGSINVGSIELPGVNLRALMQIPAFHKVIRLLFDLFDAVDLNIIIQELGIEFMVGFLQSALPVVQQVKSGADAIGNWCTAAKDWHKARKTVEQKSFLLPGNARDACDAVRTLLKDSSKEHASLATIQTAQLGVSTAGLFTDLGGVTGPAVALVAQLGITCQKVVIMGARYREMKKVNEVLLNTPEDRLSSNIFAVAPLLGCYYLANNTTSNVLNVLSGNLIEDDWLEDAEKNKRTYLDPLLAEAVRFIDSSRYVLFPIRQSTGMYVELSFGQKVKEGFTLWVRKKTGAAAPDERAKTHRAVGR